MGRGRPRPLPRPRRCRCSIQPCPRLLPPAPAAHAARPPRWRGSSAGRSTGQFAAATPPQSVAALGTSTRAARQGKPEACAWASSWRASWGKAMTCVDLGERRRDAPSRCSWLKFKTLSTAHGATRRAQALCCDRDHLRTSGSARPAP
eukprot:366068-Chlamydomonas_euryale.AAC.3